ncbi:MAG: VWA domain-containing protein [Candidatus Zixiibacteriota bacterium]
MRKLQNIKLLALAASLLLATGAISAKAVTLKPSVEIDCPAILADHTGTVYVVVQFDVPTIEIIRRDDRPDLSLAMVIDRSGSMADHGKMDYAKKSAMFVVDQLNPADKLAVVEYDDRINVLWPSQPVRSTRQIKQRIADLYPRGATNLTGGMMEGVNEVFYSMSDGGIDRVLLLSDGLANRGVTDHNRIMRMVRDARRKGITISTIGLGLDYNEDLMQMIAQHGGGNYYFVEHPNQMRDIFAQEMGTIFATVASDVRAIFRPSRGVRNVEVFGYLNDRRDSDVVVDLGSVYGGEKMSLVLRIDLDPHDRGRANIGTLELEYTDVAEKAPRTFSKVIDVEVTPDIDKVRNSQKSDITVEATLVEADNFHEKQIRLYEAGKVEEAKKNIAVLKDELVQKNTVLAAPMIDKKLEALEMEADQMAMAEVDNEFKSGYLKKQKSRLAESQQGGRTQYVQQMGDSGFEVKQLQQALADRGFYSGPVDGNFTSDVSDAVKKFQSASKLKADGIAGPATLKELGIY